MFAVKIEQIFSKSSWIIQVWWGWWKVDGYWWVAQWWILGLFASVGSVCLGMMGYFLACCLFLYRAFCKWQSFLVISFVAFVNTFSTSLQNFCNTHTAAPYPLRQAFLLSFRRNIILQRHKHTHLHTLTFNMNNSSAAFLVIFGCLFPRQPKFTLRKNKNERIKKKNIIIIGGIGMYDICLLSSHNLVKIFSKYCCIEFATFFQIFCSFFSSSCTNMCMVVHACSL